MYRVGADAQTPWDALVAGYNIIRPLVFSLNDTGVQRTEPEREAMREYIAGKISSDFINPAGVYLESVKASPELQLAHPGYVALQAVIDLKKMIADADGYISTYGTETTWAGKINYGYTKLWAALDAIHSMLLANKAQYDKYLKKQQQLDQEAAELKAAKGNLVPILIISGVVMVVAIGSALYFTRKKKK